MSEKDLEIKLAAASARLEKLDLQLARCTRGFIAAVSVLTLLRRFVKIEDAEAPVVKAQQAKMKSALKKFDELIDEIGVG